MIIGPPPKFHGPRDILLNGTTGPNPELSWLTFYNVTTPAPNLRRITVDGSNLPNNNNYLRVVVTSGPEVLTWTKVPFTTPT
jgi:hypothetical protein